MTTTTTTPYPTTFKVQSDNVQYSDKEIIAQYDYQTTQVVQQDAQTLVVKPVTRRYVFKTERKVPKLGVMLVGWGGNNGTTFTAGILANRHNVTWQTKHGVQKPDYFGSITQTSTVHVASVGSEEIYVGMNQLLPMVHPNDIEISGWDINNATLDVAMERAQVLPFSLQQQIKPYMQALKPLPGIYIPHFIASNQDDRANHVLPSTLSLQEQVEQIRKDIREMKKKCDKVIVLWTGNTERFCQVIEGVHDTAANLLKAIEQGSCTEISPSSLYCVASILENCSYINGSPQNTFVPGIVELAQQHKVFIAGDDFKSGQTKIKSVLMDFLVGAGLKPTAIVSYNHLGNNDGKNLSEQAQFRSKEVSKSNVVDDMVLSNKILYGKQDEKPDHVVVIKYVPYVGDSKRAMDEYTSRIFMGGHNTIVLHNTCEDSLLAAPLMIDLVILTEVMERITWSTDQDKQENKFHSILSILSYLLKAPNVPENTPLVNALFRQRACIENILKACVGLPPANHMLLEAKCKK